MLRNSIRTLISVCRAGWLVLALAAPAVARADRYVLVIGVNYEGLQKGQKDDFAAEARQVGNAFVKYAKPLPGKVHRRQLLGPGATRPNILKGLRWLARIKPADTAFVYICMHGGGSKDGYAVCPAGYDGNRWRETGVTGAELRAAMARLRGPSLLCVTACQSGWLLKERSSWGKCLTVVSCRASETSWLGVMGRAVREALHGKADTNHDGVVRGEEFRRYVLGRMRQLNKTQHPLARDSQAGGRAALTRAGKAGG